eukprot:m.353728 g.353728  ORF g.353728 m.353728 type:complete len:124 (-) comp16828_c0_seq1:33-404(-)
MNQSPVVEPVAACVSCSNVESVNCTTSAAVADSASPNKHSTTAKAMEHPSIFSSLTSHTFTVKCKQRNNMQVIICQCENTKDTQSQSTGTRTGLRLNQLLGQTLATFNFLLCHVNLQFTNDRF